MRPSDKKREDAESCGPAINTRDDAASFAADPRTIETNRRQLNMQRITHLKNSHQAFLGLKAELIALTEGKNRLTGPQHAMFRNCFMGIADTLYEMNDLDAAAEAYQKVSQEFMNEPLALEAMLQQSLCYEKLGDMSGARRIYQQAGEVLKRIPDEQNGRFARTTRYDREKWESLIDWLQST